MGFAEGMQALSAPVTKLVEAVSNAIGKDSSACILQK